MRKKMFLVAIIFLFLLSSCKGKDVSGDANKNTENSFKIVCDAFDNLNYDAAKNFNKDEIDMEISDVILRPLDYMGKVIKISGKVLKIEDINVDKIRGLNGEKFKEILVENNEGEFLVSWLNYNGDFLDISKGDDITLYGYIGGRAKVEDEICRVRNTIFIFGNMVERGDLVYSGSGSSNEEAEDKEKQEEDVDGEHPYVLYHDGALILEAYEIMVEPMEGKEYTFNVRQRNKDGNEKLTFTSVNGYNNEIILKDKSGKILFRNIPPAKKLRKTITLEPASEGNGDVSVVSNKIYVEPLNPELSGVDPDKDFLIYEKSTLSYLLKPATGWNVVWNTTFNWSSKQVEGEGYKTQYSFKRGMRVNLDKLVQKIVFSELKESNAVASVEGNGSIEIYKRSSKDSKAKTFVGNVGSYKFYEGECLSLTATPEEGFVFKGWRINNADKENSNIEIEISNNDLNITAIFEQETQSEEES